MTVESEMKFDFSLTFCVKNENVEESVAPEEMDLTIGRTVAMETNKTAAGIYNHVLKMTRSWFEKKSGGGMFDRLPTMTTTEYVAKVIANCRYVDEI